MSTLNDQTTGPLWFREMCAGYLRSLPRKGRRPNTVRAYLAELQPFGRWLEREAIAAADQLTGQHLELWQDFRAGEVVPKTQQVSAAAVRGALRWAATQEPPLCPPILWLRVTTPRTAILLPRPIPQADLGKLLAAIAPVEPQDLVRLRTRALFLVILSSGARISEALSLDRDQLQGRTATVTQKGGSQTLLVISKAAEAAIAHYLEARSDTGRALFGLHRFRRPEDATRLGHQGAQWQWTYLCEMLGIRRFTSHQIRHTCATELLRQHVDSLVIGKHMGHRSPGSIAGYAEVGLDARHEMLEVMDGRLRRGVTAPTSAGQDDEVRSVSDAWLQVRVNFDLGHVTRAEMETFAQLTGREDLIAESPLTTEQFAELVISEGGLYPQPPPRLTVLANPTP